MPRLKLYTSYAWLKRKWEVEKLSETEIAKLAGTSQVTINRYLREFGLKKER
jgi:DNA-binding MurR/RpiR family transcriptional regulator